MMIIKINICHPDPDPERSEGEGEGSKGVLRFFASLRMTTAQSTLEFTFAVVVIIFLIYGMVQIFRWAGMDLANRRLVQDASITADPGPDPSAQLNSDIDVFQPLTAVWHGSITNGSTGP